MKRIVTLQKRYYAIFMAALVIALGLVMKGYIAWAGWIANANSKRNNPGLVPNIAAIALLVLGVAMLVNILGIRKDESVSLNLNGVLLLIIWYLFSMAVPYTGFLVGAMLALAATLLLWGVHGPLRIAGISILAPIAVNFILGYLMKVNFPKGILGF